jgi:protein-S-isoprenylcysteine O-methyltransferase Ste14
MLLTVLSLLQVLWLLSEIVLGVATRARAASSSKRDGGSLAVLWLAAFLGLSAGNLVRFLEGGLTRTPSIPVQTIALVLLLSGLAVRWTAIGTLGRFYTTKVAVHPELRIVRKGMYRRVRHPGYGGLLLVFLGIGVLFESGLGLGVTLAPVVAAVTYRIRVEESVLAESLGREYTEYCAATKRLVPGIY